MYKLFRSPSAGLPSGIQAELAAAQDTVKRNNEKQKKNDPLPTMEDIKKPYGSSYRNMLAEELFPEWSQNFKLWVKTGGDRPYHYYGSAVWFTRIGHAMGEAMLELMSANRAQR